MTGTLPSDPATASLEAVAGWRPVATRDRDVDHASLHVADALARLGIVVTWLSTHRTVTDAGVACSAAVAADVDADLLSGYLYAVARDLPDVVADVEGDDAAAAADARRRRTEGRAVWFPGHDRIGAESTVADLLTLTAIDAVEVLGGGAAQGRTAPWGTTVQTRGFLRPRFVDGRLVLHTQPARGGVLVPFETPVPTPCCADHA